MTKRIGFNLKDLELKYQVWESNIKGFWSEIYKLPYDTVNGRFVIMIEGKTRGIHKTFSNAKKEVIMIAKEKAKQVDKMFGL